VLLIDGRPKITSATEADAEWAANTRTERVQEPRAGGTNQAPADGFSPPGWHADEHIDFNEARRLHEIERWRRAEVDRKKAELELAKARGELVDAAGAKAAVVDAFSRVRTKLLGVPARCRQSLPDLPLEAVALIDDRIREALEELADGR
jgi:hypothetical protein